MQVQRENLRALQKYVRIALQLPVTSKEYAKEFGLDQGMRDKLETEISSSVDINNSIQSHCRDFLDDTWKEMLTLTRDVKVYTMKAQITFPPLCESLRKMADAKKESRKPDPTDVDAVRSWIKMHTKKTGEALDQAERVSKGLQKYSNENAKDEGDVKRQIKFLDRQQEDNQGSGTLTNAVDRLKNLVLNSNQPLNLTSSDDTLSKWVHFVGFVPRVIIEHSPGKEYYLTISNMWESKRESVVLEKVRLTCAMMRSNWQTILKLMVSAKKAVTIIQGFFENIRAELQSINENAEDLKWLPPLTYISMSANNWIKLESEVEQLLKGAFEDDLSDLYA